MPKLIESLALSGVTQTDGTPNASGKVWVYVRGSTALAPVYTDAEGDAVTGQPVILDGAGRASIYVDQPVSLHIESAAGATLGDMDLTDSPGPIRVANDAFTGTLPSGATGAGGETDLDTVLTRALTAFGGPDFMYKQATGATARSVKAWMGEVHVSVKDYGARGDGVHDDTSACQAAINAVIALNGGVVYFPPGRYILSAALTNTSTVAVSFQGSGAFNCCLQQTSVTANVLTLGNTLQVGWWIDGLNFTANPGTSGAAISVVAAELLDIRNCFINSTHTTAILFPGPSTTLDINIHDNILFAGNVGFGINVAGTGGVDRAIIANNRFGTTGGTCINLARHIGDMSIYGNAFLGASIGIAFASGAPVRPTMVFGNCNFATTFLVQAGSVLSYKQWGNTVDGQSTTVAVNSTVTPDPTQGDLLYVNVTGSGLTVTLPVPSLTPAYKGYRMTYKLFNNNAGVTTWGGMGAYVLSAVISTAAGTMTTLVVEYDLDRAKWIEVSRAVTA